MMCEHYNFNVDEKKIPFFSHFCLIDRNAAFCALLELKTIIFVCFKTMRPFVSSDCSAISGKILKPPFSPATVKLSVFHYLITFHSWKK